LKRRAGALHHCVVELALRERDCERACELDIEPGGEILRTFSKLAMEFLLPCREQLDWTAIG
jgi:hypothetical protein